MGKCRKCGSRLRTGQFFCPVCFTTQNAKKRGRNCPRLLLVWKETAACGAALIIVTVLVLSAFLIPPELSAKHDSETSFALMSTDTAQSTFSSSAATSEPVASLSLASSVTSSFSSSADVPSKAELPVNKTAILEYLAAHLGDNFQLTGKENRPYLYYLTFFFSRGALLEEATQKILNFLQGYQKGFVWKQVRVSYELECQELPEEIQVDLYYGVPPDSLETVSEVGKSIAKEIRNLLESEFRHVSSCDGGGGTIWIDADLPLEQAVDSLSAELIDCLRANRYTSYTFWYCGTCLRDGKPVHVFHYMTPPITG